MGTDAVMELRDCFRNAIQEYRSTVKRKEDDNESDEGLSSVMEVDGMWKAEPKKNEKITYAELGVVGQMTQESYERLQLHHLFKVKAELPVEFVRLGLNSDILPLHASFRRYDDDGSGTLDLQELTFVLQEFGFLSGNELEDESMVVCVKEATE